MWFHQTKLGLSLLMVHKNDAQGYIMHERATVTSGYIMHRRVHYETESIIPSAPFKDSDPGKCSKCFSAGHMASTNLQL